MNRRAQWRYVAVLVTLAVVWLAMLLGGAGAVDRSIYEALYAGHRRVLPAIARTLTFFGDPTLVIGASVIAALWFWHRGRGRAGLVLLAVTLTGRIISEAQKYWIARARPDIEPHLVIVKTNSFPSGHAASSMIFYVSLALLLPDARRRTAAVSAAILSSLLIGTSRVMLGVHWPSDVIGGWTFGLLWLLMTFRPAERLLRVNSETAQEQL